MSAALKNNYQEYDPRHRLTGAVVLILLAIILLPMLLSKNPEETTAETAPVVMEVTKEGNKVFVSRITSVAPAKPSSSVSKKPIETADSADDKKIDKKADADEASSALFKPMSHTTTAKSSTKKTSTAKKQSSSTSSSKSSVQKTSPKVSTSKNATAKKSSTVAASSGWIVQVGVFSQTANAKKKVSELKKKGFNAKSGKVETSKGVATKVWIGPFEDRKSAERMQDRLQHKTRQRGMVVKK